MKKILIAINIPLALFLCIVIHYAINLNIQIYPFTHTIDHLTYKSYDINLNNTSSINLQNIHYPKLNYNHSNNTLNIHSSPPTTIDHYHHGQYIDSITSFSNYFIISHPTFIEIYNQQSHCLTLQTINNNNHHNQYISINASDFIIISLSINRALIVQQYSCLHSKIVSKIVKPIKYHQQYLKFTSFMVGYNDHKDITILLETYSKQTVEVMLDIDSFTLGQPILHSLYNIHSSIQSIIPTLYTQNSLSIYQEQLNNIMNYTLGLISSSPPPPTTKYLQPQQQLPMTVVLPSIQSLLHLSHNISKIWNLSPYIIPLPTPLFTQSAPSQGILQQVLTTGIMPTQQSNQHYKYFKVDLTFNTDHINEEDTLIVSQIDLLGVQPIYPNNEVHWVGISTKGLVFYPQANIKNDQYYYIRLKEQSVVLKGRQVKGQTKLPFKHNEQPQKLTIKPLEIGSGIYQLHIGYKHLISYPINDKRIEIINGLNDNSLLTHYYNVKAGYQLTYHSLDNNQWIIAEYNQNLDASIITKYQLYANASNVKQILNLKRQYDFQGRIIGVFKCLDRYYYIQAVVNKQNYAITRVPHFYLDNRVKKQNIKPSGQFDLMMQIDPPQNNYLTLPITIQIPIPKAIKKSVLLGNKLKKGNQYGVLPYSVYSQCQKNIAQCGNNQVVYLFNLRSITHQGFNKYIQKIKKEVVNISIYTLSISIFIIFSLLVKVLRTIEKNQIDGKLETTINKSGQSSQKKKQNKDKKNKKDKNV